jgi:hypothetical protein
LWFFSYGGIKMQKVLSSRCSGSESSPYSVLSARSSESAEFLDNKGLSSWYSRHRNVLGLEKVLKGPGKDGKAGKSQRFAGGVQSCSHHHIGKVLRESRWKHAKTRIETVYYIWNSTNYK